MRNPKINYVDGFICRFSLLIILSKFSTVSDQEPKVKYLSSSNFFGSFNLVTAAIESVSDGKFLRLLRT
jgi:hypothetical protein